MADWRAVSEGMSRGFEAGRLTEGKRFTGLASALSRISGKLRQERKNREALQLLGNIKQIYGPKKRFNNRIYDAVQRGVISNALGNLKAIKI